MDWRALEARIDGRMKQSFGEAVRLSFLKDRDVDPTRPSVDIRAVLSVGDDRNKPIGRADLYRANVAIGENALFIDRGSYAGPKPQPGDRVCALDRVGQPWFPVASVTDRYSNMLILRLGEA